MYIIVEINFFVCDRNQMQTGITVFEIKHVPSQSKITISQRYNRSILINNHYENINPNWSSIYKALSQYTYLASNFNG